MNEPATERVGLCLERALELTDDDRVRHYLRHARQLVRDGNE